MEQVVTYTFLAIGLIIFVFATLQLTVRRSNRLNSYLFAIFLCVGYIWLYYGVYRLNQLNVTPWLLYSDIVPTFLVGPLVLEYTRNLIGRPFLEGVKKIIPFLPALAVLGYLILFRPYAAVSISQLPKRNPDHFLIPAVQVINTMSDLYFFLHMIVCTLLAVRTYHKGDLRFRRSFRGVLIFYTSCLFTFILFFAGHAFQSDDLLGIAVLANGFYCVYFFFFCYRYPEYTQKQIHPPPVEKKSFSAPGGFDVSKVLADLRAAIAIDKEFRNPNLSLQSLSTRLGIQYHQLSQILNDHLCTNFRTFINQYRIEEAKRFLVEKPEMSIMDVAYAVGFNSKSAFNSAFTKDVGKSPTNFRKNVSKTS